MEHQFKPWQPVIVRDYDYEKWRAQFFSYYDSDNVYPYRCACGGYKQCLPAKGNRHLIGTTDSPTPPEPEFKFGDKVKARDVDGKWLNGIFLKKEQKESGEIYKVIFVNDVFGCFGKYHIRHADW